MLLRAQVGVGGGSRAAGSRWEDSRFLRLSAEPDAQGTRDIAVVGEGQITGRHAARQEKRLHRGRQF